MEKDMNVFDHQLHKNPTSNTQKIVSGDLRPVDEEKVVFGCNC